jgi:hypothetical protein
VILIGGVGELFQGDLDLGRLAAEQLSRQDLGPAVVVEELSYGAVAVAQRLQELAPEALVLIAAHPRGRTPGSVERRVIGAPRLSSAEQQLAVGDAVTGYVTIDLLVEVAAALGALPETTVALEVEPVSVRPSVSLTADALVALGQVVDMARSEALALAAR